MISALDGQIQKELMQYILLVVLMVVGCTKSNPVKDVKQTYNWQTSVTSVEYHRSLAPNDDRIIRTEDGREFWCMAYDATTIKKGDSVGLVATTWTYQDGSTYTESNRVFQNCPSCHNCK